MVATSSSVRYMCRESQCPTNDCANKALDYYFVTNQVTPDGVGLPPG